MDDRDAGAGGPEDRPPPDVGLVLETPGAGGPEGPAPGGRLVLRVGLVVAVVAALIGAVLAVRSLGDGEIDADAALQRAAAALADADSYRFTVTTEDRSGEDVAVGPGTLMVSRVVDEAEVSGDDWRSRSDAGDWVDEMIAVDGTLYTRSGDDFTPIESEPWAAWPLPVLGPWKTRPTPSR